MKLPFISITLTALAAILTPCQADPAPSNGLKRVSYRPAERSLKKKETDRHRPDFTSVGQLTGEGATPDAHPEQYSRFVEELKKLAAENEPNSGSALAIAIEATGNEFCIDLWMEKAAAEGSPVAMHYLGKMAAVRNASPELRYLRGAQREALLKKQSANAQEAANWLRKAAELKFAPAMLDYSNFLRKGIGVEANTRAADKLLLEAGRDGSFETRFSWLLENGRMSRWADAERPEVAGEIKRGNHLVIYFMSQFAPDSQTQMEWLRKAISLGNADAMYTISSVLSTSKPVESLTLLRGAAARHNPAAMYVYGSFLVAEPDDFHKKTGLQQDIPRGVSMLRTAGILGNLQSRRALVTAYLHGDFGLQRDPAKAYAHLAWLNTTQMDHISMAAQGFMLLTGNGVQQDTETGLRYISHAARAGYSYAHALRAYAHYKGLGVPQDATLAIESLQEAAATGFPHAYVYIAFLTAKGLHGSAPDLRGAERYVNIAALNLGDAAKAFFQELMQQQDWVLAPFPLEKE